MKTPQQIHTDICRREDKEFAVPGMSPIYSWSIPDGAKVKIHGFVMLRGLDDGKTFVVKRDNEKKIYWFCVPRTGRKVCGHYMSDVDHGLQCFARGDNNGMQVISV